MLTIIAALVPAPSHAAFSTPQAFNPDAATDTYNQRDKTFAAAPDGTWVKVWVAAGAHAVDLTLGNDVSVAGTFNEDLFFARSLDHGKTWSAAAELKTTAASDSWDDIEPSIATDGLGGWMVVWRSLDPAGSGQTNLDANILMTFSSDNGITWSTPAPVNTDAGTDSTGVAGCLDATPMVCCDGQGHWVVAWVRYDNRTGFWLTSAMIATSGDNGGTWTAPHALQTINDGSMYEVGNPRVSTDRQGNWIACWAARTSPSSDFDIYRALSTNNGATWTAPALLNSDGAADTRDDAAPMTATDYQGHWMATWVSNDTVGSGFAAANYILFSTSSDNGQTWAAPAPLNAGSINDGSPSIIYDGVSNWVVTLQSQTLGGDFDVFYTTLKQGDTAWAPIQPLNPWSGADTATDDIPQLAGDGQGRWMCAWRSNYDLATATLKDFDLYDTLWEPDLTVTDPATMSLTAARAVNTDAATDTCEDTTPALATDGKGAWVSVWVAPSTNPVDPRGEFPLTNDGINQDIFVAHSLDQGKTWSPPAPLKTNMAFDYYDDIQPAVATDGQGHWIVVWASKDPLAGTLGFDSDILMSLSSDNGATWTAPAPVNSDAATDPGNWLLGLTSTVDKAEDESPRVASDGQGRFLVTWLRHDGRSGTWQTSAMSAASSDNGAHWSAPLALQTLTNDYYGMGQPQIATDRLGRWIACWSSRAASADFEITFAVSLNNGATWTAPAPLNTNAAGDTSDDLNPTIATDGQGRWIALWQAQGALGGLLGSDTDLLFATSADGGATWTAPAAVNSDAATDNADDVVPQLIFDGAEHWIAFWSAVKMGADADIFYATLKQGETFWSSIHPLNLWAPSDQCADNSLQAASDGHGHWMAVWSSNYDLASGQPKDFDILYTKGEPGTPLPETPISILSAPLAVNSDATTDTAFDGTPALATDGKGTWLSVWAGQGDNLVDPRGDDPASGPDGVNQDLFFARSLDNGKTWSTRTVLKTNAAVDYADDLEPAVASDGNGHWMVVWRSRDPLGGTKGFDCDILVAYSGDNGLTWSAPAPVNNYATSDPGGFYSYIDGYRDICDDYRPSVATDRNGRWIVSWVACDLRLSGQTFVRLAVSNDSGAHWSDPVTLQSRAVNTMLNKATLATDHRGRWIVCWPSRSTPSANYNLYYAISTDNGGSWGTPQLLTTNTGAGSGDNEWPAIATDGQNHWTIVWQSTDTLGNTIGSDTDILYSTSANGGIDWSAPAPVNSDAETDDTAGDTFPSLIADGAGNWIASWTTTIQGGDQDVYYAILAQGETTWSSMQPLNPWASTDNTWDNASQLAPDGHGNWMAVWSSNYDLGGTNQGLDMDILSTFCDGTPASGPSLHIKPTALSFRKGTGYEVNVITHSQPTTQTLTLINRGRQPLTISDVQLSGPYADDFTLVTKPLLPMVFSPLSSRTIILQFNPAESEITWNVNARLQITSDDPTPVIGVPLVGDAVPVELGSFGVE